MGFVGLPLLVGAADAAMTSGNVRSWYLSLAQPPGTPPSLVFAGVWTALYVLMGVAAWLAWRASSEPAALRLWGWQLLLNASWAPAFFGLHSTGLALALMPVLLVLIGITAVSFRRRRRLAGWLLLPYLAWTCYATYLAAGFWWLNPRA